MVERIAGTVTSHNPVIELGLKWTEFTRWIRIEDDGGVVVTRVLQGFLGWIETSAEILRSIIDGRFEYRRGEMFASQTSTNLTAILVVLKDRF